MTLDWVLIPFPLQLILPFEILGHGFSVLCVSCGVGSAWSAWSLCGHAVPFLLWDLIHSGGRLPFPVTPWPPLPHQDCVLLCSDAAPVLVCVFEDFKPYLSAIPCMVPTIWQSGKGRTMGTVKRSGVTGGWGRGRDEEGTLGQWEYFAWCYSDGYTSLIFVQTHMRYNTKSDLNETHYDGLGDDVWMQVHRLSQMDPFVGGCWQWRRLFVCGNGGVRNSLYLSFILLWT